jgi:hypothetical protein
VKRPTGSDRGFIGICASLTRSFGLPAEDGAVAGKRRIARRIGVHISPVRAVQGLGCGRLRLCVYACLVREARLGVAVRAGVGACLLGIMLSL